MASIERCRLHTGVPGTIVILAAAILVSACATQSASPDEPLAITPPGEANAAAVVRRPLPEPIVSEPQAPGPQVARAAPRREPGTVAPSALPAIKVPADLLYVCVTDVAGERKQIGIEFAPKVHALCKRHPEMGPCQYERNVCRRSGGRVFAASGEEITLATEAEYDRKVLRVRFRAN
jgi:hypothetical protein